MKNRCKKWFDKKFKKKKKKKKIHAYLSYVDDISVKKYYIEQGLISRNEFLALKNFRQISKMCLQKVFTFMTFSCTK